MRTLFAAALALLVADRLHADEPTFRPDDAGFKKTAEPFLSQYCLRCHGPDRQSGEFRIDRDLSTAFLDAATKARWGEVVNMLNSHEMPPEKAEQPTPEEVAKAVDWITAQMAAAELARRETAVILRRLNRDEYRNTIRDLVGVDYDVSGFPLDPASGGFDNVGKALTMSPLHMELYLNAARTILDRALVEGGRPPMIRWRFQPESGDSDSNRVTYDGQRVIVNGGDNRVEGPFRVMHHDVWNRKINARDFRVNHEGEYVIRVRAGGKVPARERIVVAAEKALQERLERQLKENPEGERWHREGFARDLDHFRTDRMYDYGPPRLKIILSLNGQPVPVAEFDIDAPVDQPRVYEFRSRFTTETAGITLHYAYSIPKELENFWMQDGDEFPRPEAYVDWLEIEGPGYPGWPPRSHREILFDSPLRDRDERAYAHNVLSRFMRKAYRRPVNDDEVAAKLGLYDAGRKTGKSFVEAIKLPLTAVLVSPHFLYLAEPDDRGTQLNDHELAARLSYFLWSSMPDEKLFQLAETGKLSDAAELSRQVDRMLADSNSEAFVKNFAGQWLGLREVGANPPAQDLFPRYDRHLETSIVGESEAFFAEILRHDLSVKNLLRSDFLVINERLARFYGVPGVRGDHFRRVPVPEGVHRGGVVTQASVLTITSNGTRTSPVKRGTWILKNLLGTDPGLPVANAGEIAPKVPGIDKATVRHRLQIHRELPQCARCHAKIDPLGFSLENYNAAGEWRDREGFGYKGRIGDDDPPIDASAELSDGTKFESVDGLQRVLLENEELFYECLSEKMLAYALGRELGISDRRYVAEAVAKLKERDTLRSLIKCVVTSEPFRMR